MKQITTLAMVFMAICGWSQIMTPALNDILIPMRDGQNLEADVYIPEGVDSAEVILIQTPYNKEFFAFSLPMGVGTDLDDQPFIWVIVDWRGFYGSFGAADPDADRGEDGYDVCQWISEQGWHKDRIGTWGPSALGGIQYQTAREDHPNHTCAVPLVATGHQSYDSYFYGGVLEEARLYQLDALGYGLSPIVLANPYDNLLWTAADGPTWFPGIIKIPTLQIGGWYDHNIDKMMDFYTDSRNISDPSVQDEQWLLVGPWVHGGTGAAYVGSSVQGELEYPNAEFKSDTMAWEFFEYYLLDLDNGWDETPMITYYEMGGNDQWNYSDDDDIHAGSFDIIYLDKEGLMKSTPGTASSQLISDPANPSPTIGGATLSDELEQGPMDQSSLDPRDDILTFATEPLPAQVAITGRIQVNLYVESSQPDCDISIRLVDVYPDGTNMLITDGIKRMRFRNNEYGADDEVFMTPGEIYPVDIDLPFTNYTWLEGHRIKIYVSGNHASRFNVNLQDGGEMYVDGEGNIAEIKIHHSEVYPSAVKLPGDNAFLSLDREEDVQFRLYPNPVTENQLTVEGGDFMYYEIYTVSGERLEIAELNGTIDFSQFSTGLYFLHLINENGEKQVRRVVKN